MAGELREMGPARLGEWLPGMWADYRASIVAAGYTEEAADANVARNRAALTSGDGLAPGNHVFDVLVDGRAVGVVWIGRPSGDGDGAGEYYVYDVVVAEAERGRGHGRLAMELVEAWVRAAGGTRVGLNVWGNNAVARSLYGSLGYRELAVSMAKDLDA